MEPSERMNLRWDGFMSNTRIAFRELRGRDDFCDLTLVGGDGKQVRAHQVVMAGGSSFFHKIFRENPHPHPVIYLKDMKYEHLSSLLDFVYTGEANIIEDHLNEFLDMAEDLKVKGLTLEKSDDQHPKSHPSTTPDSLQGCKAQELSSSLKVSSQDPKVTDDRAPGIDVSQPRSVTSAPSQGLAHTDFSVTEVNPPTPVVKQPNIVMSTPHQGYVATEGLPPTSGVSHLHSGKSTPHQGYVATEGRAPTSEAAQSKATSSSSNNDEDRDDTCDVKVEVGDAAHYSAYYQTNENGEQYRSGGSLRAGNKTGSAMLSMEQEENGKPLSTEQQLKEEEIDCISNMDIMKADDGTDIMYKDEQTIHDWYEQSEGNDIIAQDEDDCNEVDSNYNMTGNEKSAFVNEEMAHNSCCDNMIPDAEQDLILPVEKKGFQRSFMSSKLKKRNKRRQTGEKTNLPHYKSFEQHKRVHTGEKPYQCPYCPKTFSRSSDLVEHKRVHTDENPYQCQYCPKTFSWSSELNQHKRVHTGEKPYQCPHCPKTFKQKSHLNYHKIVHTGEKPYQCPHCPKTCSRLSDLVKHKRVHTGEKPYPCPHCLKTFSRADTLKKHKRVHTGEKPYPCPHCLKTFSRSVTLNNHKRVHTGEKPYPCPHCLKTFSRSVTLNNHKRVHTGEKPYQCPHCPKTFKQKGHLDYHKRVHIGEK